MNAELGHRPALGRRLMVGIAATMLAAATLGIAIPAAVAGTVPVCHANQLGAAYVRSTAAAGTIIGEYGFRNISHTTCKVYGYPAVQMLQRSGQYLATTETHTAPGQLGITPQWVTVAYGGVAYFGIVYASSTGYANLNCPTSAALRFTAHYNTIGPVLSGNGGQIRPYGGTTQHLQCGIVHVTAVTAKRFQ